MTRFRVFNVGHGFCAEAVSSNGNMVLFDCGNDGENWRPARHFKAPQYTGIEYLVVTNYDEDHIVDLPHVRTNVPIHSLTRNPSINAEELRRLKRQGGPISTAMESLLGMMGGYTGGASTLPELPGVRMSFYYNQYRTEFDDTNNLSLVTFVEIGGNKFVVPGDLERAGWQALLRRQDFRTDLAGVNVFIASHHGRESGYCADVFRYCTPSVVIFSDGEKQYETQEMRDVYARHVPTGVQFNGRARTVLTTRCDGTLSWTSP